MPFSNEYANNILNFTFGKTNSLSAPQQVYIGLSTNNPEADNGTFNELSGGNYSRVLLVVRGATYPDFIGTATNRAIQNTKQITWNKASAEWAKANGFGLFSVASGGTPFFYGKLEEAVTVPLGAVALFEPAKLKVSFSTTDESAAVVSE